MKDTITQQRLEQLKAKAKPFNRENPPIRTIDDLNTLIACIEELDQRVKEIEDKC